MQSNETDTFRLNDVIKGLIGLEELLFYKVPIYEFPSSFSKTRKIREIYFIDCRLSKIDSTIYTCKTLELLILENNLITEISKEITQLKSLKMLSFKNNKIKQLPEFVAKLSNLEKLDLRGNPIPRHQVAVLRILMPWCRIDY
jgi:internalin A